jgi:hypothetical protein
MLRNGQYLRAASGVCYDFQMSSEYQYDWQKEAETAMRRAAATSGPERDQWVQVARVWQALGRTSKAATSAAAPEDN